MHWILRIYSVFLAQINIVCRCVQRSMRRWNERKSHETSEMFTLYVYGTMIKDESRMRIDSDIADRIKAKKWIKRTQSQKRFKFKVVVFSRIEQNLNWIQFEMNAENSQRSQVAQFYIDRNFHFTTCHRVYDCEVDVAHFHSFLRSVIAWRALSNFIYFLCSEWTHTW